MRNVFAIATLLLLGSTAVSQSSSFSLSAIVRVGHSPPETVEITVPTGSVATVDFANDLRLEFAAPARDASEPRTTTRLLRLAGGEVQVLHTTRQGGEIGFPRSNGYLVCQNEVTFMSPVPALLPECDG